LLMINTVQKKHFNPFLRALSFAVVIVFTTTTIAWAGGVNVFSVKVPSLVPFPAAKITACMITIRKNIYLSFIIRILLLLKNIF